MSIFFIFSENVKHFVVQLLLVIIILVFCLTVFLESLYCYFHFSKVSEYFCPSVHHCDFSQHACIFTVLFSLHCDFQYTLIKEVCGEGGGATSLLQK